MKLKNLLSVVMGLGFVLSMFGEKPGFNEEGRFLFRFTEPVLEMLNERLEGLKGEQKNFTFSQERFEKLVDKTNNWGWCELNNDEKYNIVSCLLCVDENLDKQTKDRILDVMDCLGEINSEGMTGFSPTVRDNEISNYIWSVREFLESHS